MKKMHILATLFLFLLLLPSSTALNLPFANKKTPVIDQWRVLGDGKLTGVVQGHPIIKDGDRITTSPLSNPDFSKAGAVVTTLSGSSYKLQQPYVQARQQLQRKKQPPPPQRRGTLAIKKDIDQRVVVLQDDSNKAPAKSSGGSILGVSEK